MKRFLLHVPVLNFMIVLKTLYPFYSPTVSQNSLDFYCTFSPYGLFQKSRITVVLFFIMCFYLEIELYI